MRALSIRQPYAQLILRGIKTIEYHSRVMRIVGERFYLYVSKGGAVMAKVIQLKGVKIVCTSSGCGCADADAGMS